MGYLYGPNGIGITKIPILEFENGKVSKYGTFIEDIKVTYNSQYVYLYPKNSLSNPIASFEKRGDNWYIYNYPKTMLSNYIGSIKITGDSLGEIYKGDTGVFKTPIGYYEGTDMEGACAAAYIAFFYSEESAADSITNSKPSSPKTSGSGGAGGAGPIFSIILGILLIVCYSWVPIIIAAIPLMIYIYGLIKNQTSIKEDISKRGLKFKPLRSIWFVIKGTAFSAVLSFGLLFFSAVRNMFGGSQGFNEWYDKTYFEIKLIIFFASYIIYSFIWSLEPEKKKK